MNCRSNNFESESGIVPITLAPRTNIMTKTPGNNLSDFSFFRGSCLVRKASFRNYSAQRRVNVKQCWSEMFSVVVVAKLSVALLLPDLKLKKFAKKSILSLNLIVARPSLENIYLKSASQKSKDHLLLKLHVWY